MASSTRFQLGPYRLDTETGELVRAAAMRKLTPKAVAVLCALAKRTGELVSKQDLFLDVWRARAVSDAALTSCIRELREALQDDPRRPQFLETLHRRGYRLLVPLVPLAPIAKSAAPKTSRLVGRTGEEQHLDDALQRARDGRRQVIFVIGEAGIGKTTLLDAFVARHASNDFLCAHGQCVEHYGPSEPYFPLLDAVARLCRAPGAEQVLPVLRRYAPSWLAQLPALVSDSDLEVLQRRAVGATRERMLREIADALEAITTRTPLVLLLEDLHWSDAATVDVLGYIARRRDPARLLVIGSTRPIEGLPREHPLAVLYAELASRDCTRMLKLGELAPAEVGQYLVERFGAGRLQSPVVEHLAGAIHARTEGNPLFVVNVTDDLVRRGVLVEVDGKWSLAGCSEDITAAIPEDLRHLIALQFARLSEAEQAILRAASVAGMQFCAAAIAAPLGESPEAIESCCTSLVARGHFLVAAGSESWPDGTVASRYRFRHSLFCSTLYEALPAANLARLHLRIADRLEAAYGERARECAGELATHFDRARDFARAVTYHQAAGENATRRSAPREAIEHYRRAIALLGELPDTYQRNQRDFELNIALGGQLLATRGYGSEEARQVYLHAQQVCDRIGATREVSAALWGLWMSRWGHGELDAAMDLAERLLLVAQRTGDQALRLQAHHALWTTCLSRGDVAAGLEHANAGCALYCVDQHSGMAARYGNHDPGACAHVDLALMLALRGEVSRARSMCDAGVGLTEEIDHPFSRAISLHVTAMIYQLLREPQLARRHAAVGVQVSKEHGFPLLGAWTQVILEWAGIDDTDEPQVVLERMHAALDVARRTGTRQMSAYLCSVLADACLKVGQVDAARVAIAEGHAVTEATNGRLFQSELLRLEGEAELLAARAVAPEAGLEFVQRGARLFTRAIEVAHGQTAHLFELRAALSYARTASATHDAGHASRQLQESLAQLPADDDCADRRDARIWLTAVRPPSYLPTSLVPE